MRFVHARIKNMSFNDAYYENYTYTPKIMLGVDAYLVAILDQRSAKISLEGPPWPIIYQGINLMLEGRVSHIYLSPKSSIVMDIDDAGGTSIQAGLQAVMS